MESKARNCCPKCGAARAGGQIVLPSGASAACSWQRKPKGQSAGLSPASLGTSPRFYRCTKPARATSGIPPAKGAKGTGIERASHLLPLLGLKGGLSW